MGVIHWYLVSFNILGMRGTCKHAEKGTVAEVHMMRCPKGKGGRDLAGPNPTVGTQGGAGQDCGQEAQRELTDHIVSKYSGLCDTIGY